MRKSLVAAMLIGSASVAGIVGIAVGSRVTGDVAPRAVAAAEFPASASGGGAAAPMAVRVTLPEAGPDRSRLRLPGASAPIEEATIHARVDGYVVERTVDIGDQVRAGQLLARIEAPEIDHGLARAEAQVKQAEANVQLAKLNLDRAQTLVEKDHVSRQVFDQRAADLEVRRADLLVAQAEVRRYRDLQTFQRITAPFAGVVVARNVEKGDLVEADSPDPGRYLFRVARLDVLRVTIDVPQTDVGRVRVGVPAEVRFAEFPDVPLRGEVVRTAGRLDAASRTLRAEVKLANPLGLPAGMIGEVTLGVAGPAHLTVPVNALVTRDSSSHVAVVAADDRVRFTAVEVGRNLGAKVEIMAGLDPGDRVVINPNGLLSSGDKVIVQQ